VLKTLFEYDPRGVCEAFKEVVDVGASVEMELDVDRPGVDGTLDRKRMMWFGGGRPARVRQIRSGEQRGNHW
jgi:hypothetical protein